MEDLAQIANKLVVPGKGILAADESSGTIKKRFDKVGIPDTEENHRKYRQLLFTTQGIEEFISGVILYEETLKQKSDGDKPLPQILSDKGIIPGIKVDQGLEDYPNHPGEKITKGLEGLAERLRDYKNYGAKFTKWRAALSISDSLPTDDCIFQAASRLCDFAKVSQDEGLVPIVEPEVLMEGGHTLAESEIATVRTLKKVFEVLSARGVEFSAMLLKPNWIHHGLDSGNEPDSMEVAKATVRVLKAVVPDEVPGIVFLSGGDSPKDSTYHLNAINEVAQQQPDGKLPWELSFSFGRALQGPVLETWEGKDENKEAAQKAFYKRAKLNSLARYGKYKVEMENG